MIGPQLQKAIVAVLRTAGVASQRVYDRVPPVVLFPYVTVGDEQSIDAGDQCAAMFDVFADIHVWSRAVGKVEAKRVGEAVRQALAADIVVEDYDVVLQEFQTSRILNDPDGLTTHAVLTFRFLLQQPE